MYKTNLVRGFLLNVGIENPKEVVATGRHFKCYGMQQGFIRPKQRRKSQTSGNDPPLACNWLNCLGTIVVNNDPICTISTKKN